MKKGDVQLKGKLTYEDFDEIISHILPKTSRELKKTRFCIILADAVQSKIASSTDRNGVEISRLATASAYMSLASAYDHHWIPQMLISNELLENCKPDTAGAKEDAKNEFTALRADFIQNEVNSVLLEGRTAGHVFNARDIDEETARMAKRMSMMNGDDEDDEEYFKEKRNAFLKLL